ncbi:ABC transporter ATP-binding protein [Micromonospora sp. NPDC052213]|uniref:ABC transporter ATP-binding protein n=1 Tax=Micromonospora sp. NPDC052213 TaxID=3155812 RepID=UPI00343BCE70
MNRGTEIRLAGCFSNWQITIEASTSSTSPTPACPTRSSRTAGEHRHGRPRPPVDRTSPTARAIIHVVDGQDERDGGCRVPGLNSDASTMPIVEVNGLSKSYMGRRVVDDVGFAVEEGEIFGILGPNGAGKTTAVECVEGLRVPDAGSIRVAGLDPLRDHRELTLLLGVQLQSSELQANLTVAEALQLYSAFYPTPASWEPLTEQLGLDRLMDQRFGKLSGGQKQRLFIALALLGRPRVVVFDELTTALDPRARRDTWALMRDVRDSGVTILLVTHFMEEAQHLCDRIAVFDRGRIVALDSPSGLIRRTDSPTVISFRPSAPLPDTQLQALPGATSVTNHGDRLVIVGTDETANAVIGMLAHHQVIAAELRVVDATLDDAFLNLTGRAQPQEFVASANTAPGES